jgi:ornithine carbamoyltransferase
VNRHFLAIADETPSSFNELLDRAGAWKAAVKAKKVPRPFDATPDRSSPLVLAMIFQKPSNRTRVSFELAMHHMGGKALYLSPQEIGLGKREATRDVAAVLGRYVDAIMARVFSHADVVELAEHAGVPIVNGLSDLEHPCQALGDFLAMREHAPKKEKLVLSYLGDGNNVCHSLMLASALTGTEFRWIGPEGYGPEHSVLEKTRSLGGEVQYSHDVADLKGSDFIYTDVWTSMGDEAEAEERLRVFPPYRLDEAALVHAPDAKVLHCLPAHRGEEISDGVLDSPASVVLDQAENRLYAQMAVLERALA